MQRTLRAAQRAATTAAKPASSKAKAAPLPYAPPRRQHAPPAEQPDLDAQPVRLATASPTRPTPAPIPANTSTSTSTSMAEPPRPRAPVAVGSKEYNKAAGKYTRAMIATPILLLTSYVLYNRFVAGEEVKKLPGAEERGSGPRLVVLDR
ncbi:hypothetical protein MN608_10417 [Microdochium nivale]|nr:hypothetical protein MN608_10417 [Microdochium nivale]